MTLAAIGYGAAFQTSNGSVWSTVAESLAMQLPPLARDAIDASHECKPGEWRDAVPGLKSGGEVTVEMNFTNEQYWEFENELNSEAPKPRRILFADGTTFPFTAFLVGLESGVTLGERRIAAAKFKVVGQPGPLTI